MSFDYFYSISNDLYGGFFNAESSSNLATLSKFLIPTVILENITSGGDLLTLTYAQELSPEQKTVLDGNTLNPAGGIVGRCNDYLQVIYEDPLPPGAFYLPNAYFESLPSPVLVSDIPVLAIPSDGSTFIRGRLQYTRGDGVETNGYNNLLNLWAQSIITMGPDFGTMDDFGQFPVRFGPSYDRGTVDVIVYIAYMQPITIRVKFFTEAVV